MKLIETKTLGTVAASIEFTSIPQVYTDLVLLVSARQDTSSLRNINLNFNGLTTNQSRIRLNGSGSAVTSGTATVIGSFNDVPGTAQTANTFGNLSAYIPNYSGSLAKTVSIDSVGENNATESFQTIAASLWNSTAAITSISVLANIGNLVAGTTVSLYGIAKGSDGITTAS